MLFKWKDIIFHLRFAHWIVRTPKTTYEVECPFQFRKNPTVKHKAVRSDHYEDTVYEDV